MPMSYGQRKAKENPYRYIYDSPLPDNANFIGRWRNNFLDTNPDTVNDPRTNLVALSPDGYNKYPDPGQGYQIVMPADEIKDEDGKHIGWAFKYIRP